MLTFTAPATVNGRLLAADLQAANIPSRVALNGDVLELLDLTESDRATAQPVIDGHATKAADEQTRLQTQQSSAAIIRDRAQQALDANKTFLAITSPSNAQVVAQVKALARQNNALIRLLLGRFDGTD